MAARAGALVMAALLTAACAVPAWTEEAGSDIPEAGIEASEDGTGTTETGGITTNGIENWPVAEDIRSDYGCLMDVVTGAVLFNKGEHVQTPPASLMKRPIPRP